MEQKNTINFLVPKIHIYFKIILSFEVYIFNSHFWQKKSKRIFSSGRDGDDHDGHDDDDHGIRGHGRGGDHYDGGHGNHHGIHGYGDRDDRGDVRVRVRASGIYNFYFRKVDKNRRDTTSSTFDFINKYRVYIGTENLLTRQKSRGFYG